MTKSRWYHGDLTQAILQAAQLQPCGIAYKQYKGWFVYNLTSPPKDATPEFLLLKKGLLPIALTDDAAESWYSMLNSLENTK